MTIIFPFEMRAEGAEDSVIVSHTISEEKELAVTEEPKDSISVLQAFLEKNRQCWAKEIIYEGCSVLLNSDGESLFVQLKILHPALQMRLLMQGMTVSVDPTGRKKEKYQTVIPSATDVTASKFTVALLVDPIRDDEATASRRCTPSDGVSLSVDPSPSFSPFRYQETW